jgi:hypothetical protein
MFSFPLPNVSPQAQAAFKKNHAKIIERTVSKLLAQGGQFDHLGGQAESILAAGFEFTSSSLEACMLINDPTLLADQMRWSKDRLPHEGIHAPLLVECLRVYADVIAELLPAFHSAEIVKLIHLMITAQRSI